MRHERALAANQDNVRSIEGMATALMGKEEYDTALAWLEKALTKEPDDEVLLEMKADALRLRQEQDAP